MPCPSCGHQDADAADACGQCGFSLQQLMGVLGSRQVHAEPLIDLASCLSIADTQAVHVLLDAFERRFPQVAVTTFLGDLPGGINPAMAGVWLLNHARLERCGQPREARFALALIINPVTGRAGLATGFALEEALPSPFIRSLLAKAAPLLWHREHARAIRLVVDGLDQTLRRYGHARRRLISGASVGRHLGLHPIERQPRSREAPQP